MSETYNNELDKVTVGFGVAAIVTIVLNTILTIAKESYPPLLAFMKGIDMFGVKHHWIVHGLTITILFFLLGLIFGNAEDLTKIKDKHLAWVLVVATVVSGLGIVAFFALETFE